MKVTEERMLETIPVGPLGIVPLESCRELGEKVDKYLATWRRERENAHKTTLAFEGYQRDSYILDTAVPRWAEKPEEFPSSCHFYMKADSTNAPDASLWTAPWRFRNSYIWV